MSIGTGTDLGGTGLGGLGVGGSGPGDEPGTGPLPPPVTAPIRGRRIRLPHSPKIIAGLVMLAAFLIVAIIGPLVAPYNPSASSSTTNGVPQPPSDALMTVLPSTGTKVPSPITPSAGTFSYWIISARIAMTLPLLVNRWGSDRYHYAKRQLRQICRTRPIFFHRQDLSEPAHECSSAMRPPIEACISTQSKMRLHRFSSDHW